MDYMPSVLQQTVSFVYSAGLGFCFGLMYDFFRIFFYLLTGSDKKLSTVRDIIYMLFCLSGHFLFVLVMCSGRIMLFTFVGEVIGLTVYFRTLSSQLISPVKRLIIKIRGPIRRISLQVKSLLSKISGKYPKFRKNVKKTENLSKKDLKKRHNLLYNFSVLLCKNKTKTKNRGDESGRKKDA